MSKLSFRARALDASKPMPIYLAEELPDLPDYSAINRAVPQMPSGMEKEEESEHHLQRAISGTGLIIPTPEVCEVIDLEFYERCYPPDYKMPKQHIHMQPLWEEQEAPEYDIDSEDERWLKQQRHPELTELLFEQMMDKLEKCSGQTVVTLGEAKLLLERKDDLVIAVYDYWLNKRLNTVRNRQHPLILSVKTDSRPGQSTNNPYLAFRRRTEKMQTRKNRKNDESSYEKMLKLRRDLARALSLLQLVAAREQAKRDLVKLTAALSERRYVAGDFASQLLPDPPPRPVFAPVSISTTSFRREAYAPHFPPRHIPQPIDTPRQREKRPYKRRKHRHHNAGAPPPQRETGVYHSSSSEESGGGRADTNSPDDGPYAFRRKPGCYYEMPTATLCGDPVDPEGGKEGMFKHEIDERHRYTLTSVNHPYPRCIGFARRRIGRGGRVILDRVATPLDDLWPRLSFDPPGTARYRAERDEEVDLETKVHRTPKELSRDYHTSGKYPWRHSFRQHLAKNPHLWIDVEPDVKIDVDDIKIDMDDVKVDVDIVKVDMEDVKVDTEDVRMDVDDLPQDSDISLRTEDRNIVVDSAVRMNLESVLRKRSFSACSDSSYDSDESLYPVEKEFEKFINEVNRKWLHFRPKTPPPLPEPEEDRSPWPRDAPLQVELRTADTGESCDALQPFTTSEFTLAGLFPDTLPELDQENGGASLDISGDDLLKDNLGLTEAQVHSILSDTDLKPQEETVSGGGGAGGFLPGRGCSRVRVYGEAGHIYVDKIETPVKIERPPTPPRKQPVKQELVEKPVKEDKVVKVEKSEPSPVPNSRIIIEEVNEVMPQIKLEKKKSQEVPSPPLITHATVAHLASIPVPVPAPSALPHHQSPLRRHVVTQRVHVSDTSKVRLQNHLLTSQAGSSGATVVGLVQNGPFTAQGSVAVALPVHGVSTVSVSSCQGRRPVVQVAPPPRPPLSSQPPPPLPSAPPPPPVLVAHSHTIHHVAPNKLKVLHAHPLTQSQRTQLLAQNRGIAQLPAVVSLATLGEAKTNTALLKAAPGSVTQFFEIKGGQLGKGPHLVNVVRQPQPGKTVTRLDLNDGKKRQVVATFDGTLKGNIQAMTRPHRVNVSLDGRQVVRAGVGGVRHQIQLKNRTFQVAAGVRAVPEPSTSAGVKAAIPGAVVANLLHKNVHLPKGAGPKISISAAGHLSRPVSPVSAAAQAVAFSAASLRRPRQLAAPSTATAHTRHGRGEIVEASSGPAPSAADHSDDEVRRRGDTLPMGVT